MPLHEMRERLRRHRDLSAAQRDRLAQLVIDYIGMKKAVTEAADEWSEDDWKRVLKHDAFRTVCKEKALEENNADLIQEATRYAGTAKVKEVLG